MRQIYGIEGTRQRSDVAGETAQGWGPHPRRALPAVINFLGSRSARYVGAKADRSNVCTIVLGAAGLQLHGTVCVTPVDRYLRSLKMS